jgi:GGDEF domain-containing protein
VVPQLTVALLLAAVVVGAWRGVKRSSPLDGGLAGVGVASFVLLNWPWFPHVSLLFTSAAGLILVVAVLRDSHNMAFCDDLTGLPSRRALNEDLRGMGRRYALAMVDVDHFKKFNDTHGHDVGDQVLRMVAFRILKVAGGGRAYRYGGEEFTIIFPGKDSKDALTHLEALRKEIADYRMTLRGPDRPANDDAGRNRRAGRGADRTVSVTVSMGLAEAGEGGVTPEQVLKAADSALYRAKSKGRNQVCS